MFLMLCCGIELNPETPTSIDFPGHSYNMYLSNAYLSLYLVDELPLPKTQEPKTLNGPLFQKGVFANITKLKNLRTVWTRISTTYNNRCLYTRQKCKRLSETQEGDHVKTEVEIGVVQPEANNCQQLPKAGRGRKNPLWSLWVECDCADTLISDSGFQKCVKINFCYLFLYSFVFIFQYWSLNLGPCTC
jgi:hypothetical protein